MKKKRLLYITNVREDKKIINQTTEDKLIEKRGQERDGEQSKELCIWVVICDKKEYVKIYKLEKNVFAWLNK